MKAQYKNQLLCADFLQNRLVCRAYSTQIQAVSIL